MINDNGQAITYYSPYMDEFDQPIERTPLTHSYSYDGFIVWRGGKNEDANGTVYSDRLFQWDSKKYNELSQKHFGNHGQVFYDRKPKKIEAFLRDYMDDPKLKLVFVMQYCNVSSGYPLWRFEYHTTKV